MRKYLYNLVFILSNILFPVITFAYAARVLEPEGIGRVQMVLNLAQYFVIVAAMGLSVYGVRETARATDNPKRLGEVLSGLVAINLITTLIMLVIYFILIWAAGWLRSDPELYLMGGLLILSGFLTLDWFYTGRQEFRVLSLRSLVVKLVALGALLAFVKDREDLWIYLAINVGAVVLTNGWNALAIRGYFHWRGLQLRRHIRGLSTLFLITVVVCVYTLGDTLMVGYMAGERSAGLYTAAIKMSKLIIPLIVSLGVVLIPEISRLFSEGCAEKTGTIIGKSFVFICLTGIPASVGLMAFAPEIIVLFSGSAFIDAVPSMRILSFLPIVIGLGHLFGLQLLVSGGFEKRYLLAVTAGMIISVALNLILIPRLQQQGAAIANLAAEIAVTGISAWFVYQWLNPRIPWSLFFKSFFFSFFFLLYSFFLRHLFSSQLIILLLGIAGSVLLYSLVQWFIIRPPLLRELIAHPLKR